MKEDDDASDASTPASDPAESSSERPPPSRSYAPESLTPFKPIQAPDLPDSPPRRDAQARTVAGVFLGIALVAFVVGGLLAAVMAR